MDSLFASDSWTLPKVDPKNVYKNLGLLDSIQFWRYKVKEEVLQTTSNNSILHSLNIINLLEIDASRKAGYNFSHFSHVQIVIQPLHRKGQDVAFFLVFLIEDGQLFLRPSLVDVKGLLPMVQPHGHAFLTSP